MLWTDRQGLNALNTSGNPTGDTQDYVQQINARIAIGKFISSLFGGEGIYAGGANSINEFLNSGKEFPATALIINADTSSSVTLGPVATVTIHTAGTGYSIGNILTISSGHINATVKVTDVSTTAVSAVEIISGGSAYAVGNGKTTTVSPAGGTGCKLNITAIAGEPWFFSSLSTKSINFSVTNAGGNTGALYAQITPVAGLSPVAADGDVNGFRLIAQNTSMTIPSNSILLGTGTISNSAFTSWTPSNYIFVDATPQVLQSWIANTLSGSLTVEEHDTLNLYGQNGINTSVSETENKITYSANIKSDGGLQADSNGLGIKIKTNGGLGVNSTGIFVANNAIDFNLSSDIGDDEQIIDKETLTISVMTGMTSVGSATDVLTVGLSISTTGGLETTPDNKLSLKLSASGKLSKDSDGLYSQPVSFLVSGQTEIVDNIIQTIQESEIFEIYGTNSIYTDNTSGTSGRIEIGMRLDSLPGLTMSGSALAVLVDASPGSGNEAIILDANGLSLASAILNTKYGKPTIGTYATGDFYRDNGGSLFYCDSGGTPGTWSQLSIGVTRVTSDDQDSDNFILPEDSDFNGAQRQRGYRLDWVGGFDYLNEYKNTMPWIWCHESIMPADRKYWISQSEFPIQFGKLYIPASTENSNPIDVVVSIGSYTDPVPTITVNTVAISAFKAFWSLLENKYDGLFVQDIYASSKVNPTISLNYTYNPFNLKYDLGDLVVASNLGTVAYDGGLEYFIDPADETKSKRIILATFDVFANEYSHRDLSMHCRYINDPDGSLDQTPYQIP